MNEMLIAGNWKMNTTPSETTTLINELKEVLAGMNDLKPHVLVCPPFTNLYAAVESVKNSIIKVGAQNCYFEPKGAFTGEISVDMIKDTGCSYCIVGHSERRTIFNEGNDGINRKVLALLEKGIKPVLCIGETIDERNKNQTFEILKIQLDNCLDEVSDKDAENVVVAYEPIWAIGTGVAAEARQIHEAHEWIRNYLYQHYGETGKNIYILYGGSLNPDNAEEIFNIPEVNGGLIGGASLKSDSFLSLIKSADKLMK